jgi:hypothetical protein
LNLETFAMKKSVLVGLGVALSGIILARCGGSSPAQTNPTPVVVSTPTPRPSPTPTPLPLTQVKPCPLPPSSNPGSWEPNGCARLTGRMAGRLAAQVNAAMDRVLVERPDLFNFQDMNGGNPRVLDRQAYHVAVVSALSDLGVCGNIEKEEIAIKNTNEFNEQWNIWTSSGFTWRKYETTCTPSWF